MTPTDKEDFNSIFNFSRYMYIHPTEAGTDAFDLLQFLYDLRDLPDYQATDYGAKARTDEEREHVGEMVYTTKSIADNFLMVAPILLYRLVESYLKKYLLILYESTLFNIYGSGSLTIEKTIMTGNIKLLEKLYLESSATIDITSLTSYSIIGELRELNNSLKHNHDLVSAALHNKNNYWITDDQITVEQIKTRIADFDHGIGSFFFALVDKAKPFFP